MQVQGESELGVCAAPGEQQEGVPVSVPGPVPNKGLELTASSVRSCLAPASSSSSGLAFIRLRVAAPDERRGDRGVHSWAIRLRCALPDNPGVDSAKVPANHTPCWQGLSPVTPTLGFRRDTWYDNGEGVDSTNRCDDASL